MKCSNGTPRYIVLKSKINASRKINKNVWGDLNVSYASRDEWKRFVEDLIQQYIVSDVNCDDILGFM